MATAKINLLGEELVVKGEGDAEYLQRLAAELDGLLKRLAEDLQLTGQPTKTALLVAINLLDELTKLKEAHGQLERTTTAAVSQMLRRIEDKLKGEETHSDEKPSEWVSS